MPRISIILPTYNGEKFIATAIKSVLAQDFTDWELLVISDGSKDNTESIVTEYGNNDTRIILIKNENNLGIQKTLNKGIALSKGEYIARIDDDDRWIENTKLSKQVIFFDQHDEYVLIGTDAVITDDRGGKLSINILPKKDGEIRSVMLSKNCFLHASVLMRKSSLDAVGGYSEDLKFIHAEDYELWLRLGTVGKFCNLGNTSVQLMNHSLSLTSRNRTLQAKNILNIVILYKNAYPHFLVGYAVAYMRYVFFMILKYVPFSRKLFYFIQRIYKKI